MRTALLLAALAAAAAGDEALLAQARELQRASGYAAALALLEERMEDWRVADAYVRVCAWAGEEERGLAFLARCALPARQRAWARADLLASLGRFRDAAAAAREAGKDEAWVAWAEAQASLRDRLAARGTRALRIAAAALAAFAAAAWALWRLAPRA